MESSKGSVIDPEHLDPEGVNEFLDRNAWGRCDVDLQAGPGAFAPFNNVGGPVVIGPALLIGMEGHNLGFHRQIAEVTVTQQGGIQADFRHEHFHAPVGIGDGDFPGDGDPLGAALHLEGVGLQLQRRGGPEAVAEFKPQQA